MPRRRGRPRSRARSQTSCTIRPPLSWRKPPGPPPSPSGCGLKSAAGDATRVSSTSTAGTSKSSAIALALLPARKRSTRSSTSARRERRAVGRKLAEGSTMTSAFFGERHFRAVNPVEGGAFTLLPTDACSQPTAQPSGPPVEPATSRLVCTGTRTTITRRSRSPSATGRRSRWCSASGTSPWSPRSASLGSTWPFRTRWLLSSEALHNREFCALSRARSGPCTTSP